MATAGLEVHHGAAWRGRDSALWQVSGRSDLTWEEAVRLDLHYIDNWSSWLDLVILCRTVRAVTGQRGAH